MPARKVNAAAKKMAAIPTRGTGSGLLSGLLKKADAARELGVCVRSIETYVKQGLLVMRYVGRARYVDISASNRRLRGERDPAPRRRRRQHQGDMATNS
jgi:hypothetical protein